MSLLHSATDRARSGEVDFAGAAPPPTTSAHRRSAGSVYLELAAAAMVMVVAGASVETPPLLVLAFALTLLFVHYGRGVTLVRPGLPHATAIPRDGAIGFAMLAAAVAVLDLPRSALMSALVMALAMLAVRGLSLLLRRWLARPLRILLVGDPSGIAETTTQLEHNARFEISGAVIATHPDEVLGILPPARREGEETLGDAPTSVAAVDDLDHLIEELAPEMVLVVPGDGVDMDGVRALSWKLASRGVALAVRDTVQGVAPHRIEHCRLGGVPLMQLALPRAPWPARLVKALIDRVGAAVLLALTAPLIAALILVIRWESPGPGIFRQIRIGKDGAPFTIYKLRSMGVDAEARKAVLDNSDGNGLLFKDQADPRVTRLGRFIRRTSLDELPQLLNVLRGEMSLIGPRPNLPTEVARYTELEGRRLAVRPGMTGLWQVSGRSLLDREESARLDAYYTDNVSLTHDASIAVRTVRTVLAGPGAY